VIEAKLFTERNVKTEWKELKELGKDLEKYTRTRNFGGLRSQAELRNMTAGCFATFYDDYVSGGDSIGTLADRSV
jgi:hypothetical protein